MLCLNMIIAMMVVILAMFGQAARKFPEPFLTPHTLRLAIPIGLEQRIIN